MHLSPCSSFSVSDDFEPSNEIGPRFSKLTSSPSITVIPFIISLEDGGELLTEKLNSVLDDKPPLSTNSNLRL